MLSLPPWIQLLIQKKMQREHSKGYRNLYLGENGVYSFGPRMRLFVTVSISSEWKDEGWLSAITTTTTTATTTLSPTTIKKMNNLDRAGGRRQRLRRHDLLMRVLLHLVLHVVAAAGKERKRTFKNPRNPSGGKERELMQYVKAFFIFGP